MKFRDSVGDHSCFPTPLPDCLCHVFCGEEIRQISDIDFQITLTSDRVAGYGWVPTVSVGLTSIPWAVRLYWFENGYSRSLSPRGILSRKVGQTDLVLLCDEGLLVGLCMLDYCYKSLDAAATYTICATLVDIQTHTHTHTDTRTTFRPAYVNSAASWALKTIVSVLYTFRCAELQTQNL